MDTFALLIVLLTDLIPASYECASQFKAASLGDIFPEKPVLFEGSNVILTCVLSKQGLKNYPSGEFSWEYKNKTKSYIIPSDHYARVNQTHNALSLYNVTFYSSGWYTCYISNKMKKEFVCESELTVGRFPSKLENVTIVSHHLNDFMIMWNVKNSYLETNYSLYYHYQCLTEPSEVYNCPVIGCHIPNNGKTDIDVYSNCSCHIPDIHHLCKYTFMIEASTKLGNSRIYEVTILPENYVKPNTVTDLYAISKNSKTLVVLWQLHFNNSPDGGLPVNYEIFYKPIIVRRTEKNHYMMINVTYASVTLNNLNPHRNYSIKIRAKLSNPTSYYSDFAYLNATTMEDIPQDTPAIVPGMFSIISSSDSSRTVNIYWKDIDKVSYGSSNIFYKVFFKAHKKSEAILISTNKTFIEYDKLNNGEYNVTISASNDHGTAETFSTIFIPAKNNILENLELDFFLQLVHPDYLNLSWIPLPKNSRAIGITIYWCEGQKDSINCVRTLKWTQMTKESSSWGIDLPVDLNIQYQVATSVEYPESSSGMKWWSNCKAIETDQLDEFDVNNLKSSTNSITVKWQTSCKQQSLIMDYIIRYCPIHDCNDDTVIEKVIPKTETSYTLIDLKSFIKYNITFCSTSLKGIRLKCKTSVFSTEERNDTILIVGCVLAGIIILFVLLFNIFGANIFRRFRDHLKIPDISLPSGITDKAEDELSAPHLKKVTYKKTKNIYERNVNGRIKSDSENLLQDPNKKCDYGRQVSCLSTSSGIGSGYHNSISSLTSQHSDKSSNSEVIINERNEVFFDDEKENGKNHWTKYKFKKFASQPKSNPIFLTKNSYISKSEDIPLAFLLSKDFDHVSKQRFIYKFESLPSLFPHLVEETHSSSHIKSNPGYCLTTYLNDPEELNIRHKSCSYSKIGFYYERPNQTQSYVPFDSLKLSFTKYLPTTLQKSHTIPIPENIDIQKSEQNIPNVVPVAEEVNYAEFNFSVSSKDEYDITEMKDEEISLLYPKLFDSHIKLDGTKITDSENLEDLNSNDFNDVPMIEDITISDSGGYLPPVSNTSLEVSESSPSSKYIIDDSHNSTMNEAIIEDKHYFKKDINKIPYIPSFVVMNGKNRIAENYSKVCILEADKMDRLFNDLDNNQKYFTNRAQLG